METEIKTTDPFFKFLLKILGIIAGISGGISIVFSGAGFLLLKGNSNLLGIGDLVQHSVDDYLYEGSLFFINTIADAVSFLFNLYALIALAMLILLVILIKKARTLRWVKKLNDALLNIRVVALVLLLLVMLMSLFRIIVTVQENDILFVVKKTDHAITSRADSAHLALLRETYVFNVLYVILSCSCCFLIYRLLTPNRNRPLTQSLFLYFVYSILLLTILTLPISYGKLCLENDFYKVTNIAMSRDEEAKVANSDDLWLINNGTNQMLLFSRDENVLEAVNTSKVVNITLGARANIFEAK